MIVCTSGHARSGKDTFALMLAEELNKTQYPPFVMMAYAHELKSRCQQDFDLSYEQLWGDDKEVYDKRYPKGDNFWTGREIMQEYGQFFRTIDNGFWVKHLFKVIDDKEYINVIITDGRHKNEIDVVCDRDDGYHIRVERESKDEIHNQQHISETALDDPYRVDFTVVNNWSLDVLKRTAAETADLLINSEKIFKKLNMKEK